MASKEAVPEDGDKGEESPCKRVRYSDHDVKIILKYTVTDENEQQVKKEKEYLMYGLILSSMSTFFDTCLSADMKEKRTKEIIFHDISPELFELAIKFQTDHVASKHMIPEEAVKIVEFYHRHGFENGLELCDCVLDEWFCDAIASDELPEDLDYLLKVAVMVDELELEASRKTSQIFLKQALNNRSKSKMHAAMFSVETNQNATTFFR